MTSLARRTLDEVVYTLVLERDEVAAQPIITDSREDAQQFVAVGDKPARKQQRGQILVGHWPFRVRCYRVRLIHRQKYPPKK